jgi:SAM-dependent methyltransferase
MNPIDAIKFRLYQNLAFKFSTINRIVLSGNYITGQGIEIGAMNIPLLVKRGVKVRYLDRVSKEESAKIFPEIAGELVDVDIIGNGETLDRIPSSSNDFVIGNHFIEHTQNPIFTIKNMLRILRTNGIAFIALPDKRYTFDQNREITSFEHLMKDYEQGPEWSESGHYFDFVKNTEHGIGKTNEQIESVIKELKSKNFSIHFHVWDHQAMIDMFSAIRKLPGFSFDIEMAIAARTGGNESIFILRKI